MMGRMEKVGTPGFKYGHFLVSMLDFWGDTLIKKVKWNDLWMRHHDIWDLYISNSLLKDDFI